MASFFSMWARSRLATFRPPLNIGSVIVGAKVQVPVPLSKEVAEPSACRAAGSSELDLGEKAARAAPMLAFAARSVCSALRMSGRCVRRSEGSPSGSDTRPGSSVVSDTGLARNSTTVTAGFGGGGGACGAQPLPSTLSAPSSKLWMKRFSGVRPMCQKLPKSPALYAVAGYSHSVAPAGARAVCRRKLPAQRRVRYEPCADRTTGLAKMERFTRVNAAWRSAPAPRVTWSLAPLHASPAPARVGCPVRPESQTHDPGGQEQHHDAGNRCDRGCKQCKRINHVRLLRSSAGLSPQDGGTIRQFTKSLM